MRNYITLSGIALITTFTLTAKAETTAVSDPNTFTTPPTETEKVIAESGVESTRNTVTVQNNCIENIVIMGFGTNKVAAQGNTKTFTIISLNTYQIYPRHNTESTVELIPVGNKSYYTEANLIDNKCVVSKPVELITSYSVRTE